MMEDKISLVIENLYASALAQHQAGQLADAEASYRDILDKNPHHADSLHMLGVLSAQRGKFNDAIDLIEKAIALQDTMPDYHTNLAAIRMGLGQTESAIVQYERAASLQKNNANAQYNLGVAYKAHNRLKNAAESFLRAIELSPDHARAYNDLGSVYFRGRNINDAISCFARATALKPDYAAAHNNLGNALRMSGEIDNAIIACRRAIALKPDFAEAYTNLGNALKDLDRIEEAAACYERAVTLKPGMAEASNNFGNVLQKMRRFEDAAKACRQALILKPDYAEAYNNLGNSLAGLEQDGEAAACYQKALSIQPDFAEALNDFGALYMKSAQPEKAVLYYEAAIACNPDYKQAHANEAFARLLMGDFETGWQEHEWRLKAQKVLPQLVRAPQWDGGDLKGKTILLHGEQGLGDNIQFVRYVDLVKNKGGRVFLYCIPTLKSLFESLAGDVEIFSNVNLLPPHDCQASLMSLPALLKTSLETIPAIIPYLHSSPARRKSWQDRLRDLPGQRIGIVWRGNQNHSNDRNRSMAPASFSAFLGLSGISVVVVQKDATQQEIDALDLKIPHVVVGPDLQDMADTAALLSTLDLVITVDTAICHLSGALGIDVWTLLPFAPDWRWMLGRAESPWYPTMRLFRQPERNDWPSVVKDVRHALMSRTKATGVTSIAG